MAAIPKSFNRRKLTIVLGIFAVIIVAIAIICGVIDSKKIHIAYAPFVAEVRIDGNLISNNSRQFINEGTHKISVSLPHFKDLEVEVEVNDQTKEIFGQLTPSDDKGMELSYLYDEDYVTVRRNKSKKEKNIALNYNVRVHLPIEKSIFRLVGVEDLDDGTLDIRVYADSPYIDVALHELYALTYYDDAVSGYDVELMFYENPFSKDELDAYESPKITVYKNYKDVFLENGYRFADTVIYEKYAGVTLCRNDESGMTYTSHAILEKNKNSWRLLSAPYPVVSRFNIPKEVPISFLNKINQVGCPK